MIKSYTMRIECNVLNRLWVASEAHKWNKSSIDKKSHFEKIIARIKYKQTKHTVIHAMSANYKIHLIWMSKPKKMPLKREKWSCLSGRSIYLHMYNCINIKKNTLPLEISFSVFGSCKTDILNTLVAFKK